MDIVLIPDKFKGSLSAREVISALSKGIRRAIPQAGIASIISSDGGDGFLEAIEQNISATRVFCNSVDPLGRPMSAPYLIDLKEKTAYLELAICSGMTLLHPAERDPAKTSTQGTGMQIRDAINQGATKIYLGLGGSATNDGGIGIAHALGYRFLNHKGQELEPVGGNLSQLHRIETSGMIREGEFPQLIAVNDVDNPLTGANGAARIYAAQKGASPEQIVELEEGLKNLDSVVYGDKGKSCAGDPGAGAAGGAAYGLRAFLGAKFVKGIDFLLSLSGADKIFSRKQVDLIITGEGAIDEQTLQGKLIHGVLGLGKKHGVPVIGICGMLELKEEIARSYGLEAVLQIRDSGKPVAYSMKNASRLVEEKIYEYLSERKYH